MFNIKKFGANIAQIRKKLDMTQSELADKLFVTRQAVSKYEQGESFPEITVLTTIAEIFGVTLDSLICAGEPTKTEAAVLENAALKKELPIDLINDTTVNDIINIAPFLKPSLLDKISDGFAKHGIDISKIVELAEYMDNASVIKMLENATFETLDEELLEKFLPFLNDESKFAVFQKILEGEIDWHFLKKFMPHNSSSGYFYELLENAVVYGALDWEVLDYLRS